jgi:hypothetical protein
MTIFWIILRCGAGMIAMGIIWWFIFRAAIRDRNYHGEFGYRDIFGQ